MAIEEYDAKVLNRQNRGSQHHPEPTIRSPPSTRRRLNSSDHPNQEPSTSPTSTSTTQSTVTVDNARTLIGTTVDLEPSIRSPPSTVRTTALNLTESDESPSVFSQTSSQYTNKCMFI